MAIRIEKTAASTLPIRVGGVSCLLSQSSPPMSLDDISRELIWLGNTQIELGLVFSVKQVGELRCVVWGGDLQNVHWLGAGLSEGEWIVEGDLGRYAGSRMTGGTIRVRGDAGDFLGCEMKGGSIVVDGDAGDWVGAAFTGKHAGMRGGYIAVRGNSANGTGHGMRCGAIIIGGNSGRLTGWNMRAGTIVVGKTAGPMVGTGMVRGTIILPSQQAAAANRQNMPPSFIGGAVAKPTMLAILDRWLSLQEWPNSLSSAQYRIFHGDHRHGGRGEILIAER